MKPLLFSLLAFSLILVTSCKKDDNSITITPGNVNTTVTSGTWKITYFAEDNDDETSNFSGYTFTFGSSNVLTATKGAATATGTWSTGNDDSQVKLVLNFTDLSSLTDLDEINDDWHVIGQSSTKIKLQDVSGGDGGTDYLTFEKN